jgi:hypothetical protein
MKGYLVSCTNDIDTTASWNDHLYNFHVNAYWRTKVLCIFFLWKDTSYLLSLVLSQGTCHKFIQRSLYCWFRRNFVQYFLQDFFLYVGFQNENTVLPCRPISYSRTKICIFCPQSIKLDWSEVSLICFKDFTWCCVREHVTGSVLSTAQWLADSVSSTLKCTLFVWDWIPHGSRTVFLAVLCLFYLYGWR